MKKGTKIIAALLMATLLLSGCSRKGIHMSKHRKSRKCNCPTFTQTTLGGEEYPLSSTTYDNSRGRI